MANYNKKEIMLKAWDVFRKPKSEISFGEALHRAWNSAKFSEENEKRIKYAARKAGVASNIQVNTWAGWKKAGYTVRHGEKAKFKTTLRWASRGDDAKYTASFFTADQVELLSDPEA